MDEPRSEEDDEIDLLSGMVAVYAAMLGATMAGQVLGIVLCSVLGLGTVGIPLGCSVALESAAGARLGAAKYGGTLTPRQAGRISATYSAALLGISVPLVVWMEVAHKANGQGSAWTPARLALAVAVLGVATLARWGLMVLASPRSRP